MSRIASVAQLEAQILAALGDSKVGGETYDREWPGCAAKTMW